MKLLWLTRVLFAFESLTLLSVLATAQSRVSVNTNQTIGSPESRTAAAQLPARAVPAGQALQVKFGSPTSYNPGVGSMSVAVADLRGNGKLDMVVANYCESYDQEGNCMDNGEGSVAVLLGNGDGTFQPAVIYGTGAYGATSVAVGDVNGDGIPDIVVADTWQTFYQQGSFNLGGVSVLLGNGDGTFQPAVVYCSGGYNAYAVALGDLNGDGNLDIVVTNTLEEGGGNDGSVSVLLGNGDGTFQPAVSYDSGWGIAASVAIADINDDGIPDLVVANYCGGSSGCYPTNGEVGVLLGNGDGTFQPAVVYNSGGEYAYSVAVGDLRGDGIQDVVVANRWSDDTKQTHLSAELSVLLGNGDGTFQPAVSYIANGMDYASDPAIGPGIGSLAIADVNGDGIPDVAVVEWCQKILHYTDCVGDKEVNVFLGKGDGTLQSPFIYSSDGFIGSALAVADVNGDGRPDLVVANNSMSVGDYTQGSVAVLLNETSYTTKTVLISSPNPAQVNQAVTFTATVSSTPAVPNGEVVTFYNGQTEMGTGTTTGGVATLTTSFSKAGTYTIKASYPGDAFRKKSSGTAKQVVNQ